MLSSFSEALDTLGPADAWPATPSDRANALTLTRTIEQLYRGGASTVYAVRVGDFAGAPPVMTWSVNDAVGPVLGVQANSPGTWANALVVTFNAADHTLQVALGQQKEARHLPPERSPPRSAAAVPRRARRLRIRPRSRPR